MNTRRTRKELEAEIAELRQEVANLRAVVRNRPPVFSVNDLKVEGCAVYVTGVEVEQQMIDATTMTDAGARKYLPGVASMSLRASGPFPVAHEGKFWLIPQESKEANP